MRPPPSHPSPDLALQRGERATSTCPLCAAPASPQALREASWYPAGALQAIAAEHPDWRADDGACPACVQQALLELLLKEGDEALHAAVQSVWPLDARAAFGALPTPLRLHADSRFSGRGVTMAFVDSAFHPHPDLATPRNRIRAWVDASQPEVQAHTFGPEDTPRWPGWNAGVDAQWHGTMTSTVACGNGALSRGLFRGMASEAQVVLVQVRDAAGSISNAAIARALAWLHAHAGELGLGVVSLSVGGEPLPPGASDPVDAQVRALVADGVLVVAAAGNDGERRLVPPATAPEAITVGGIDDRSVFGHADVALWHSNYGITDSDLYKPELVAPSVWVVAPVLPGTQAATEAAAIFAERFLPGARSPRPEAEASITARGLVTPHYQHVEGTSFAAPLVASAAACVLEANRELGPSRVREVLVATAQPVPGAARERQGAGALEAGRATALALAVRHDATGLVPGARLEGQDLVFRLHDRVARRVEVFGSWNGWAAGTPARAREQGLWEARVPRPALPRVAYKFRLDEERWLDDPANPRKAPDGAGGLNAVLVLDAAPAGPHSGPGS